MSSFFRQLTMALGIGMTAAATAPVLAAAPYDFGQVSTFATTKEETIGGAMYAKVLTFSLAEAAEVRIDQRVVGHGYYNNDAGSFRFGSPLFDLFDSNHTRVGYSMPDVTFSQTDGNDCTLTACTFNQGMTLTKNLSAGSYSIEFVSYLYGTRPGAVYFGVSKNDAAVLGSYLAQVTPPGAVPEGSTFAMMVFGLAAMGVAFRKHQA